MNPLTNKTPAWLVEQAAQGELGGVELDELRSRLAAEGRSLDDELEQLRQSNRQILNQLPREMMGAAIRRRAAAKGQAEPGWHLSRIFPPLAAAGALGLIVLVARGIGDNRISQALLDQSSERTTSKGDEARSARLLAYRQRPGRLSAADSELLGDGARVARGDLLQLAYDKTPEGMHGVLISIDGAGKVTLHLPDEGSSQAPLLTAIREIRLPSAYELDDAPGFERFLLVTAAQPFAIATVVEAARALAHRAEVARTQPLPLPRGFVQTSLLLNKMREGTP